MNPSPTPLRTRFFTANRLFWLTALLTVLPIFTVRYLPLVDLSGHLGRIEMLKQYDSDPELQGRYQVIEKPLPNLSMDAIMLTFSRFLSMENTSRMFVLVGMLTFIAGCACLSYSLHQRIVPLASLALFLQYNSMFFYGFVAYQFGVGLFLLTLALWYRWRQQWTPARLAVLLGLGILVYFGHLAGYIFLGVAVGIFLLFDTVRLRRIPWSGVAGSTVLMAPVGLYLSLGSTRGQAGQAIWSSLPAKMRHAFVLLISYDLTVDISVAVLLAMAAVLAWKAHRPTLHVAAGILAGAFWLCFFISPSSFLTGTDADARFVLPAGVFTLLALQFPPPRMAKVAYAIALAVCVARLGYITWTWQAQDRLMTANIDLYDHIPRGARVYPIFEWSKDAGENKFERPLFHAVSWATVHRDAIVPTNFTVLGQHSMVEREGFWYKEFDFSPEFEWEAVFSNFDIIWFYGTDPRVVEKLNSRCKFIAMTGKARLYQVRPLN